MTRVYEEIIDFIASGSVPQDVVNFRPSEEARQRFVGLLQREKEQVLSADEQSELDHYLQLEHLMRLAKAKAHQHLHPPDGSP